MNKSKKLLTLMDEVAEEKIKALTDKWNSLSLQKKKDLGSMYAFKESANSFQYLKRSQREIILNNPEVMEAFILKGKS